MTAAIVVRGLVVCSIGLGISACGAKKRVPPPPLPPHEPFIALERDLQGFRDWEIVELTDRKAQSVTHLAGRRREYVNRRPPPGATTFPVGTMFVKELMEGAEAGHQLFAMVKRGGGYNKEGAPGWEWFELRPRDDDSVGIVWRGINAPIGEDYGGDPTGGCNACHGLSAANDYVKSPVVRLGPRS